MKAWGNGARGREEEQTSSPSSHPRATPDSGDPTDGESALRGFKPSRPPPRLPPASLSTLRPMKDLPMRNDVWRTQGTGGVCVRGGRVSCADRSKGRPRSGGTFLTRVGRRRRGDAAKELPSLLVLTLPGGGRDPSGLTGREPGKRSPVEVRHFHGAAFSAVPRL